MLGVRYHRRCECCEVIKDGVYMTLVGVEQKWLCRSCAWERSPVPLGEKKRLQKIADAVGDAFDDGFTA